MKCTNKKGIILFLFVTVCITVICVRCTPEKKIKVLSFFFDGVPDPTKKTEEVIEINTEYEWAKINTVDTKNKKPTSYDHKPFAEEKCGSCHDEGFSNALVKPIPNLCYSCHEDINTKYQTLHGPVASGNCMACHAHHQSKFEKLLPREGQELCLFCHESYQVFKNKKHEKIGDKNCTECHDPHGGENRGLLKAGTCYQCHEDFGSKYKFVHGPVASGNCNDCHNSHSSEKPKLLLREAQEICLFCHDAQEVFKNPTHKKAKKSNCTECHNPHGGEDRYILLQSILPSKNKSTIKITTNTNTNTNANANTVYIAKQLLNSTIKDSSGFEKISPTKNTIPAVEKNDSNKKIIKLEIEPVKKIEAQEQKNIKSNNDTTSIKFQNDFISKTENLEEVIITMAKNDTGSKVYLIEPRKEEENTMVMAIPTQFPNILFDFDRYTIKNEYIPELVKIAALAKKYPEIKFKIYGFTDNKGNVRYNIDLSAKRTKSVVNSIVKGGVSKKRIITKPMGKSHPVATNNNPDGSDNAEGRRLNRRVEIKAIEVNK